MAFNGSNYVLDKVLKGEIATDYEVATYKGVFKKTLFFLLMTVLGVALGIVLMTTNPNAYIAILSVSITLTFILAIISFISPSLCKYTGTMYCVLEGFFVGFMSLLVSTILEGAVTAALISTFAVFAVVTTLFLSNIVKVKSGFIKFLLIFAISMIVGQFVLIILDLFDVIVINYGISLTFSLLATALATLYLFFDLQRIREIVEGGYPKNMEWLVSFGLAYTIIWLYIEILRLIIILADKT